MDFIDYDAGLKSKKPDVVKKTEQLNSYGVQKKNKGKWICKRNIKHPRVFEPRR